MSHSSPLFYNCSVTNQPPTPVLIGPFPDQQCADYFLSTFERSADLALEDPDRFRERLEHTPMEIRADPAIQAHISRNPNDYLTDDGYYLSLAFASHVDGRRINKAISTAAEATIIRFPHLDPEAILVAALLVNVTADYAERSIL